jgi:hypothetical protein
VTAWAISTVDGNGQPYAVNDATGQDIVTTATGPYRPRAGLYGTYVTLVQSDASGHPAKSWCLVRLGDDANLVAADADQGVRVLDAGDLDRTLGAAARNQVNTRLADMGATTRVTAGMTVRQALAALCAELGDPSWGPVL